MDTASYWAKRELQLKKRQIKNTSNYEYALESRLKDLQREINKEVKYWMTKYADNNEISQQEAERILNGIDTKHFELTLEEFERKAKQGGNDKLLNSEYYKSRVARAEQIKKQLEHLGGQFAGTESDQLRRALEAQYVDTYYHETWLNQQAYGGFSVDFNHFDEDQLRTVAGKPWQGSDFSERVWGEYHKELPSQLSDAILRGILLGESYAKVSKRLEDRMADVKKSSVHRLVATEMGHVAEQATYDFYKDEGLEEYEYLATLETRTCGICGGLDGKHFKVSEAKPGVNYPLIHPYCRCTTIPYRPDLPPLETRWERDPKTGKGRIVNYQTYDQWAGKTGVYIPDNIQPLFHKNSYHLPGTDYISSYRLNKMMRKFIRRGGNVIMGEGADRHLRYHSASAVTLDQKTIMISSWATRSAVLEELYHIEQLKKMGKTSISDLTPRESAELEIDAQHYLLKNAKKLKLTDDEIQELHVNLAYWREKKERAEDAESD